jgi:hypothetical protein
MRQSRRRPFPSCFSRAAVAALLSLLPPSGALASDAPDFSGVWVEISPKSGPPLRIQLTQSGSRVQVRLSGRDNFPDRVLGVATIEDGTAVWRATQACVEQFQWPGYNYDKPGVNTFTLALRQPTQLDEPGPLLVFVVETHWKVPCASNHPIGTERTQRILRRQ